MKIIKQTQVASCKFLRVFVSFWEVLRVFKILRVLEFLKLFKSLGVFESFREFLRVWEFESFWEFLRVWEFECLRVWEFLRVTEFSRVFESFWEFLRVWEVLRFFKKFLRVFTFCLTRARNLWRWLCFYTCCLILEVIATPVVSVYPATPWVGKVVKGM